jgi:hypothetical protein
MVRCGMIPVLGTAPSLSLFLSLSLFFLPVYKICTARDQTCTDVGCSGGEPQVCLCVCLSVGVDGLASVLIWSRPDVEVRLSNRM